MRTNLQPEIATTSVRTGLAMTKWGSLSCHCEERSDAAISCRNYQMRTNLQPEIATTGVRTGLAMTNGAAFPFGGTVPHSLIPSFFISTTAGAFDRSRFF